MCDYRRKALDNNTLIKDYTWSSFPFQLCSTPLYILPLIIFLKDNKVVIVDQQCKYNMRIVRINNSDK